TDILVKSIDPVVIDVRTGREAVVYFGISLMQDNYKEKFNGADRTITYVIEVFEDIDGNFIPIHGVSPISAKYKKSTYYALFGNMTLNQIEAQKADLMIAQIDYNSAEYFDLTADKLEKYV
ncbi:MAG: hypothetical protein ACKO96_09160, partial [Flammeovirgaceae bacterium]